MEQKVTVLRHLEPKSGTSSNGDWTFQTVITETIGDYPKKLAIDIWNNRPAIPEVGSTINAHCNVESRESANGNWFTSAKCWKWELEQAAPIDTKPIQESPPAESSDLPF